MVVTSGCNIRMTQKAQTRASRGISYSLAQAGSLTHLLSGMKERCDASASTQPRWMPEMKNDGVKDSCHNMCILGSIVWTEGS